MKSRIMETHILDKHEEGVHSSKFDNLGPVQRSLGDDFPEPDIRFLPKTNKLKKKRKNKNE